jgi:hypothetical protein
MRMVSICDDACSLAPFVMAICIAPESIGSPFLRSTNSICPAVTSASKMTSIAHIQPAAPTAYPLTALGESFGTRSMRDVRLFL